MKTVKINVKGKTLGRAASEAAKVLIGKDELSYSPNKIPDVELIIENVKLLTFEPKKAIKKTYYKHSGYLGKLKTMKAQTLIEKDPQSYFKKVVSGMLPNNKLKVARLKRMKFSSNNG